MDDYELPPGTEIGRDATSGLRYPITMSRLGPYPLLGGRRIEGAAAAAGGLALLLTVYFVAYHWWGYAAHRMSISAVILTSMLLLAGVPVAIITGVTLSGITARDVPLHATRAMSKAARLSTRIGTIHNPVARFRLRHSPNRAWVAPRRDLP